MRLFLFFRLTLAVALGLSAGPAVAGLLDGLLPDDGIVPVEQAMVLLPPLWNGDTLILGWEIAPGCYLYRDKMSVEVVAPAGSNLGQSRWPPSQAYRDDHFGEVQIYRRAVQVEFLPPQPAPMTLRVRFQGCAEDKVCYPPQTRLIEVPAP